MGAILLIQKATEVKVNIKPVMGILVHSDFWEGPCRGGIKEEMMPEAEMRSARVKFENYKQRFSQISGQANLLEPVFVPYDESFVVDEKIIAEIEKDLDKTDCLMVMNQRIPKIERFNKPVISWTHTVSAADTCAYLRSIGKEAWYPIDMKELNELIHLLWVRKAAQHTRVLVLTAGEAPTWGLLSNIRDTERLRSRYGIEIIKNPFTDIFKFMDTVTDEEAMPLTEKLYGHALENKVKPEFLINDVKYYLAAEKMLEKYSCNAFSTSCVELCRSRIPQERKFVPCITHTLFKDRGIPSACEEDLNALTAMIMLMYTAMRPAFMGNPLYESDEMFSLHHSVPCLKMNGFDTEDMSYSIYPFTGQGFGGKIQIDFAQSRSEEVTLARFNTFGDRMLLKTGNVLRSEYKEAYCSPYYYIQADDVRGYLHQMMNFGHHQALVFGNWRRQLYALSKIMGFEIVEGSGADL
ncbi:MAG TPA: hypothetical protein IAB53_08100 [Candidatus Scybalocola faecipullorum]|nr:hypothetical protein [Candidatus Scybalocola faecipullorum]